MQNIQCARCGSETGVLFALSVKGAGHELRQIYLCEECLASQALHREVIPLTALALWVARNFKKEEAEEVFNQTCPVCGMPFLRFLLSPSERCFHCYEYFSPLFLYLIQLFHQFEEKEQSVKEKAATLSPEGVEPAKARPEPPPVHRIFTESKLKLDFLKERLEALIKDEKYEEAQRLSEMIKSLSQNNQGLPSSS